jgi:hypothetical protein
LLQHLVDPMHNEFGYSMAGRGVDFDGDALPDTVVGVPGILNGPGFPKGALKVYSGRDASVLHFMNQPMGPMWGSFGWIGNWVYVLRPPPGQHTGFVAMFDGTCCLVATPSGCQQIAGSVRLYRGTPRTAQVIGRSCAGNLAAAPDIGMRTITGGVRVSVARAPANVGAVLLAGVSTTQLAQSGAALPLALDPLGLPGCSLRTSIELVALSMTGSTGPDAGYAAVDLPYPIPAVGVGSAWVSAQWWVFGDGMTFPGGMTQAIRWRR